MTTLSRFEIHQPGSVAEASQMLGHYGDQAAIYAGGTELLLAMRHRALSYNHLIDLKIIPGLNAIEERRWCRLSTASWRVSSLIWETF